MKMIYIIFMDKLIKKVYFTVIVMIYMYNAIFDVYISKTKHYSNTYFIANKTKKQIRKYLFINHSLNMYLLKKSGIVNI